MAALFEHMSKHEAAHGIVQSGISLPRYHQVLYGLRLNVVYT